MSQGRDWLTDLRKDPGKPRIQCGPLHLSGQEVSLRLPNPIPLSAHCYKTALKNNPSKVAAPSLVGEDVGTISLTRREPFILRRRENRKVRAE